MSFHEEFCKLRSEQWFSKPQRKRKKQGTDYYRVTKVYKTGLKQGYCFVYRYYEGSKQKSLTSTDLKVLEEKVRSQGLPWTKKGEI